MTSEINDCIAVVKLDGMNKDEMSAVMKKFEIKSPLTNNPLTEPIGKHYKLKSLMKLFLNDFS